MNRFWTALAVTLAAIFAATGCNDYGNTFQVPTGASISALSPSSAQAGSAGFTLTVIPAPGTGFIAKTVVQWNGQTITTHVQTDANGNVTGITADVPASLVAKPGTAFVNTLSPHSGAGTNGLSNPIAFIVTQPGNPIPSLSSIAPSCTAAGGPAFTLTISGSNFLPTSDPSGGSQALWGAGGTQTTLPIVSISTTQVQATVSGSLIATAGTASVSVFNPPAPQAGTGNGGGGTSPTSLPFTISSGACPANSAHAAVATQTVGEETPAVSTDGRFVAYSAAQDGHAQIFVRDTCQAASGACEPRTLLVSAAGDGAAGNSDSQSPSMTADGRYVAFSSAATNLLSDAPSGRQIYLRDTCLGAAQSCAPATQLISTDPQGALVGTEAILPSVSASGRFVAFVAITPSHASGKPGASTSGAATTNSGLRQVFVRDTCLATSDCRPKTTRISLHPGDSSSVLGKLAGPALSGSGERIAVPDAKNSTMLNPAVAVNDRVFLALTSKQ